METVFTDQIVTLVGKYSGQFYVDRNIIASQKMEYKGKAVVNPEASNQCNFACFLKLSFVIFMNFSLDGLFYKESSLLQFLQSSG